MSYTREEISKATNLLFLDLQKELNEKNFKILKEGDKYEVNFKVEKGQVISIKVEIEIRANKIETLKKLSYIK